MNTLNKYLFALLIFLLPFSSAFAQRKLTLKEISRTLDYTASNDACIEIISNDEIMPRTTEDFEVTRLDDGKYSYKVIADLEIGKGRQIYIVAPMIIEQKLVISGLKPNEYIKYEATLSRDELEITEVANLAPSKNANAIYRFYTNLANINISTDSGQKFENKGENDASFFVYELSVPVANNTSLTANIEVVGYDNVSFPFSEINYKIYGFFIFPKEECFNKNIELGSEYFKLGLYDDALMYYGRAIDCNDRNLNIPIDTHIKQANDCKKIKDRILYLDKRADIASRANYDENIDLDIDSTYWYRSGAIDGMHLLKKRNPADEFSSDNAIQTRTQNLYNGNRMIGGIVTDLEYTNQVLSNVIIYGAENRDAKPNDMMRLGESDANGKFRIKVPNSYKMLYFEHGKNKDYNKPIREDITNGRKYKYHVKLQRKVVRVGF